VDTHVRQRRIADLHVDVAVIAPGEAWNERKEEADVPLKLDVESSGCKSRPTNAEPAGR
jgi:hypothetical protein